MACDVSPVAMFSCYDLIFSCLQRGGKMTNRYPWLHIMMMMFICLSRREKGFAKIVRIWIWNANYYS